MRPFSTTTQGRHGEFHIRTNVNRTCARPPRGVPWKPVELQTRPHNPNRQDSYPLTASITLTSSGLWTAYYGQGNGFVSHCLPLNLLLKDLIAQ